MKKILVAVFTMFLCCFSFAEPEVSGPPKFEKENSIVIDKYSLSPMPKDFIKMYASFNVKGDFSLFVYKPELNGWQELGTISFSQPFSTQRLKTQEKALKYRYFAVTSNDSFDYDVRSKDDDLFISVSSKDKSVLINGRLYKTGFCIIDYESIDNDVEDFIKLQNYTKSENFKVSTFVFHSKKNAWLPSGTGYLKSYGDVDTVKPTCPGDLDDYHIMALIVDNNINFSCEISAKNDDLWINLISDDLSEKEFVNDIKSELEKLKEYYENGLIDESEYKEKKSKLLGI